MSFDCFYTRIVCEISQRGSPSEQQPISVTVRGTDTIVWDKEFIFQVSKMCHQVVPLVPCMITRGLDTCVLHELQ